MQQDYILRMVQQFTGFLVRVMRLRKEGEVEEALALVTDGYGRLAGLPGSLVHALSEDDLLNMLRAQGRLDPQRCLGLAELLREEGHIYDDMEKYDESYPRYLKSLRLYLEVVGEEEELGTVIAPGIDDVIEQLSGLDLPVSTTERLADYLELVGKFDLAENILLQQVEQSNRSEKSTDDAIRFYRRLLQKSDAELIVGGLTKDEVFEGLERIAGEQGNESDRLPNDDL
jgi:tetratricopeptide (TPR) repeat protein